MAAIAPVAPVAPVAAVAAVTPVAPVAAVAALAACTTPQLPPYILINSPQQSQLDCPFYRGPTANRQMTPIGKVTLKDSQFRLQDMKEIYTTGNGLYNNIVHKILVKGKQGRRFKDLSLATYHQS